MSEIQAPRRTGWFKLSDTWIRLADVQAWRFIEASGWMRVFLRERQDPLEISCDHLQAMAFEAAIQEL
jgi:hypothetical protein